VKKKIAEYYDNLYSQQEYTFGGEKGEPTNIVIGALKYINSGKVLDIGAGEGRNSLFLAEKGFEVEAVDISEVGIKKLKNSAKEKELKIKVKIADLNEIDLDDSYDMIVCSFITHHFIRDDVVRLFEKMKKHTNYNGLNVISSFTKDGDFFSANPTTDKYYPAKGEIKDFYKDWAILEYREEKSKTRKTHPDGSPMFNFSSLMITQKKLSG